MKAFGTCGEETAWRDRRNSQGRLGIPLISSTFVAGIPMIARLLHEVGVPLDWVDSHDPSVIIDKLGDSAGLFFVDDAAQAVDAEGRKIIPAQNFVTRYDVRTVFGIGTVYDTGQMLVTIVFCREGVSRASAERCLGLIEALKEETAFLVSRGAVFDETA